MYLLDTDHLSILKRGRKDAQLFLLIGDRIHTKSAIALFLTQAAGVNDNSAGAGIYGKGGRVAGFFEGDVEVTGDIRLTNADCAEDFVQV